MQRLAAKATGRAGRFRLSNEAARRFAKKLLLLIYWELKSANNKSNGFELKSTSGWVFMRRKLGLSWALCVEPRDSL